MENAHWVLSVGNKIWLVDGQTREHTTGRVHPSFPSLHQLWRLTWPLASQEIPQFSLQKEVSSEKFFKLKNIFYYIALIGGTIVRYKCSGEIERGSLESLRGCLIYIFEASLYIRSLIGGSAIQQGSSNNSASASKYSLSNSLRVNTID